MFLLVIQDNAEAFFPEKKIWFLWQIYSNWTPLGTTSSSTADQNLVISLDKQSMSIPPLKG